MTIRWSPAGILAVLFIGMFSVYLLRETLVPLLPTVSFSFFASTKVSLRSLLCASVIAATRGGVEVKHVHDAQLLNAKNKGSSTKDPLTDGDLRSHYAMFTTLKRAFPELKVISEEHDAEKAHNFPNLVVGTVDGMCPEEVLTAVSVDRLVPIQDLQVWIDPLDATQEYTENLLQYVTTMVGIALNGVAIGGVIHRPFEAEPFDRTFWAVKDFASSSNMDRLSRNDHPDLKVIVSRSHSGDVEEVSRGAFQGRSMDVISAGGAGYKTLEVIAGRASVYLHTTKIKKWDLCAPNGLLNSLGGKLTTLKGEDIDYSAPYKEEDVVNHGGVVAALVDHAQYVNAFSALKKKPQHLREDS